MAVCQFGRHPAAKAERPHVHRHLADVLDAVLPGARGLDSSGLRTHFYRSFNGSGGETSVLVADIEDA
jgi:hypothetical protein